MKAQASDQVVEVCELEGSCQDLKIEGLASKGNRDGSWIQVVQHTD